MYIYNKGVKEEMKERRLKEEGGNDKENKKRKEERREIYCSDALVFLSSNAL